MLVLAVDPGTDKCGLALMDSKGTVLIKEIVLAKSILGRVKEICQEHPIEVLLLGDRTGSKQFRQQLRESKVDESVGRVEFVDEHRTSEEARRRYLLDHRKGWRKIWPVSLQTPSQPYDDYVALILAERFLRQPSQRTSL